MKWRHLGIGLFVAGGVLIVFGLAWDTLVQSSPAARRATVSAGVKACAAKFDDLARSELTPSRAHEVMRACDVAIADAPLNCSAFLSAAGRAGFTAEHGIATGRPSDLEPYEASRRDANASRRLCNV
jgi:hypothetical protein